MLTVLSGGYTTKTSRRHNLRKHKPSKPTAKKKTCTVGTKLKVYNGTCVHTSGGLYKKDLKKNKNGRIVPILKSKSAKSNLWIKAIGEAKKELGIEGFVIIKKGTQLYNRAKYIHQKLKNDKNGLAGGALPNKKKPCERRSDGKKVRRGSNGLCHIVANPPFCVQRKTRKKASPGHNRVNQVKGCKASATHNKKGANCPREHPMKREGFKLKTCNTHTKSPQKKKK